MLQEEDGYYAHVLRTPSPTKVRTKLVEDFCKILVFLQDEKRETKLTGENSSIGMPKDASFSLGEPGTCLLFPLPFLHSALKLLSSYMIPIQVECY